MRVRPESAFISVHQRLTKFSETNCFGAAHKYWPLMNTDERGFFDSLTERVLGAVFEVSNTLGAGFLERVYERALLTELGLRGIRATAQASRAFGRTLCLLVNFQKPKVEWKRIVHGFQIPEPLEEPAEAE